MTKVVRIPVLVTASEGTVRFEVLDPEGTKS